MKQLTPEQIAELSERATELIGVLNCIASFETEDIDGDDLDLRFETAEGVDTGCTISITSNCQDAADVMQEMLDALAARDKRIAEQNVELFKQSADIAEISISRKKAWQQASAAREGFDEQLALREEAEKRIAELEREIDSLATVAGSNAAQVKGLTSRAESAEQALLERQKGSGVISALKAKLQTADKLQDNAFRHGLQHGFSLGQTDDQSGFEQAMAAYSSKEKAHAC
ncbi:hypothetical protein ACLBW0_08540 [Enterobacteriaceae bacterium C34A]